MQAIIDEFSVRVGQQAVVVVATPGKSINNFKVLGVFCSLLPPVLRIRTTFVLIRIQIRLRDTDPDP